MWLNTLSVRVEPGDRVEARYSLARTAQQPDGYELSVKALVHVYIGDVSVFGPPAVVGAGPGAQGDVRGVRWREPGRLRRRAGRTRGHRRPHGRRR